jgi:stress response protein YsnF
MAQTVIGFFDNPSEAQAAVQQLESIGISRQNIDVSSGGSTNVSGDTSDSSDYSSDRSTSGYSAERSVDNDGEKGNAITRFFSSLFGDDDDADRYSKVAGSAQSIVTVHAQSQEDAERAADILDDCGAIDVDERSAQHGYARTGYAGDAAYSSDSSNSSMSDRRGDDDDTTIERIEENLEVGKREVERGGVRVRSRIVERPVEETVRLREEHVHVERTPVNRSVTGDLANFEEQDIELTERAEVPVVNKEARVVEEIRISKETEQREETVRDTVRSTEVDIDDINTQNRDANYNRGGSDLDDDGDLGTDTRTGGRTTF